MSEYSTMSTEEILAKRPKWNYDRTDRNGTRYFIDYTCQRCGGSGASDRWLYTGCTCYECGGSGQSTGTLIKIYTEAHEAKLAAQRQARAQKRQAENTANAILHYSDTMSKLGFSQNENSETGVIEWVVYRIVGDTFPIKDTLKELGCKFNRTLGWYCSVDLDGYETQRMTDHEVLNCDNITCITWKTKEEVAPLFIEASREVTPASTHQGTIGETINRVVTVKFTYEGKGYMGKPSFMYLLEDDDGNIYKWSTSAYIEDGARYAMRAKVKDHAEYKNTPQTIVNYCKMNKIED